MTPYYADAHVTVHHGDCLAVLRDMPADSVDAVCTDPPYGLEFMGRAWDRYTPAQFAEFSRAWAAECLRVLKPGGHLLAFGGTRTWHRLVCGIEDAGFGIRDTITWLYGSGFPKSLDVGKAIDRMHGAEREVIGSHPLANRKPNQHSDAGRGSMGGGRLGALPDLTAPATDDARRWHGWGTALKPASESIVVARKPLAGTVAGNVLTYGTGALNIDACRVAGGKRSPQFAATLGQVDRSGSLSGVKSPRANVDEREGRWPSNVVLSHVQAGDGADACAGPEGCVPGCPVRELDQQSGTSASHGLSWGNGKVGTAAYGDYGPSRAKGDHADSGGSSRFFPTFRYEAKAPSSERPRGDDGTAHPTVKPLALMRWLIRLVTPSGGLVLDPFAGSGTTAEACVIEGMRCITIDNDPATLSRIVNRLTKPLPLALDIFGGDA